ncbi:MAG: periplasmic heavy metal sensor, partial [Caldithrix sp.]|nr:periplasmic heavy metal sensor [Caldithrix sp.]
MKRQKFFLFMSTFLFTAFILQAQPYGDKRPMSSGPPNMDRCQHWMDDDHDQIPRIPDLTEDQKEKVSNLRTVHLKDMLPLRNKMGELRAELRTLSTATRINMGQINAKIEKIGELHTEMMKKRAGMKQEIRKLL